MQTSVKDYFEVLKPNKKPPLNYGNLTHKKTINALLMVFNCCQLITYGAGTINKLAIAVA